MGVSKRLRSSRAQYPHRPLFIVKGTRISKRAALENNWKSTQFFLSGRHLHGTRCPTELTSIYNGEFFTGVAVSLLESLTVSGLNTRTPERAQAAKLIGRSGRHQLKNLVRLGGCEKRGALAVGIRSSNPGKRQVSLVARVKARVRPAVRPRVVCFVLFVLE